MRYFNFFATGIEDPTVFDDRDLAIVNNQTNLAESDLVRIGGGRFGYYAPLREMIVEYKTSARRNLIPGSLFTYNTYSFLNPSLGDSGEILLEELDADNLEARLSYTSNLSMFSAYNLAGFTFQPHIFFFAAIINQKGFVIPVQEFEDSSGWSLGTGFSVDEKKLKFNVTNTSQAAKSLIAATIGFKYSVKLKITFDQGNMKVYMGGAVFELTESGDFEFDLLNTSSGNFLRLVAGTSDTTIGTIQNVALSFVMNGTRYGRFTSTNGNLILQNGGTFTDSGERFQLTGSIRINGQQSATSGGNSGQHLIINLDGTTYKIKLELP
jgi:hypothetical protein